MEEVTMKFNFEDSEDEMDSGMKMVEDSSIHSEDLDADLSHRQRPPATFIAPPPPTEPPPSDSEPVDINMYGTNVTTTDIGKQTCFSCTPCLTWLFSERMARFCQSLCCYSKLLTYREYVHYSVNVYQNI